MSLSSFEGAVPRPSDPSILLDGMDKSPLLVLGDVMLDRTLRGEANRLSPEAPVPVVRLIEETLSPGGAANVAHNLARLGCPVALVGLIGGDSEGGILADLSARAGVDVSGLLPLIPATTAKTRVVADRQQMIRLDRETFPQEGANCGEALLRALEERLAVVSPGALLVSDYAKGVCSSSLFPDAVARARSAGAVVLVDPKGPDWGRYRGADCVTPNLKELSEALGERIPNEDDAVVKGARVLMNRFGFPRLLVTRSDQGMTLVESVRIHHERARALEVFDVSGAGDTVLAVLGAFLAAGADWIEAIRTANLAAGYVVGRRGTYAISREELRPLLSGRDFKVGEEIILRRDEAVLRVRRWRRQGFRVVFTNGCFDLLHPGHLATLEGARALGDRLIVGLNSDASVARLKGPERPIQGQTARARILGGLACVDAVVIFDEDTPEMLLSELRPHILAKGGDYRPEEVLGAEFVEGVVCLPFKEGHSTTEIVGRLRESRT
jgi:D-beta-D-heptose 7-phosphate kinase/D-beta-D-heptose 1-phosphate adenosyltransferase